MGLIEFLGWPRCYGMKECQEYWVIERCDWVCFDALWVSHARMPAYGSRCIGLFVSLHHVG